MSWKATLETIEHDTELFMQNAHSLTDQQLIDMWHFYTARKFKTGTKNG